MKITLSVPTINPEGFSDVEAEFLFDLAPHLASVATFAIHEEPRSGGFYWNVSNVETGMWVGRGWSKREAISEAKKKLGGATPESMDFAYKRAPQKYPQLANALKPSL